MLIGQVKDSNRSFRLQHLVDELARTHISRYPITVTSCGEYSVQFNDERAVTKEKQVVAELNLVRVVKDGMPTHDWKLELESNRIVNNKFRDGSDGAHSRKTDNDAKMRKLLKEHVVPFSSEELTNGSLPIMSNKHRDWRYEAHNALRDLHTKLNISWFTGPDRKVIVEDILKYMTTGQPYTSKELKAYASQEYLSAYKEHQERENTRAPLTHVFINPDGMTYLTTVVNSIGNDVQSFNSMEALPENILSQVAMLKVINNGSFVNKVGVQISDASFWVYA